MRQFVTRPALIAYSMTFLFKPAALRACPCTPGSTVFGVRRASAGAEHLCVCFQFDVDLQADYRFIVGKHFSFPLFAVQTRTRRGR